MWTIVNKAYADQGDNWASDLLVRFPQAANPDDTNFIIVAEPKSYRGAEVSLSTVAVDQELGDDKFAFLAASYMVQEDRSIPLYITKSDAQRLSNHPAWRLWCGQYESTVEDKQRLQEDWEALRAILNKDDSEHPDLANQWPEYNPDLTVEGIRTIIKTAIITETVNQ